MNERPNEIDWGSAADSVRVTVILNGAGSATGLRDIPLTRLGDRHFAEWVLREASSDWADSMEGSISVSVEELPDEIEALGIERREFGPVRKSHLGEAGQLLSSVVSLWWETAQLEHIVDAGLRRDLGTAVDELQGRYFSRFWITEVKRSAREPSEVLDGRPFRERYRALARRARRAGDSPRAAECAAIAIRSLPLMSSPFHAASVDGAHTTHRLAFAVDACAVPMYPVADLEAAQQECEETREEFTELLGEFDVWEARRQNRVRLKRRLAAEAFTVWREVDMVRLVEERVVSPLPDGRGAPRRRAESSSDLRASYLGGPYARSLELAEDLERRFGRWVMHAEVLRMAVEEPIQMLSRRMRESDLVPAVGKHELWWPDVRLEALAAGPLVEWHDQAGLLDGVAAVLDEELPSLILTTGDTLRNLERDT